MTNNQLKLDVRVEIVHVMRAVSGPVTAYGIAKKLHRHVNLISYHLTKLEADKLVIRSSAGYRLIPVLYDPLLVDALYAVLTPYVSDAAKLCANPCELLHVLDLGIRLFMRDLQKRFGQTGFGQRLLDA